MNACMLMVPMGRTGVPETTLVFGLSQSGAITLSLLFMGRIYQAIYPFKIN